MNTGKKIKQIRELNKLTQDKFAESINISRGSLSQIESERANATVEILKNIINTYNLDANYFFKKNTELIELPNIPPNIPPNDIEINKYGNLSNLKGNLSENRQKKIDGIIETESKQIMNEIFGDYGGSIIAESEKTFKPSENIDFSLLVIRALEHLNTLYLVVKLLLDNGHQFSKKEAKELYYYEKIVCHLEEIDLSDTSITVKKFLQISNIVNFKLYLQLNSYIIELKKVLGMDEDGNFKTILNKSDKE